MSELPYQAWFEDTFSGDPFVRSLPWQARNAWRCVLQTMWANHGWLPADDHKIARQLGCDVRTWRALKPLLSPGLLAEVDPFIGPIYRQKRVRADWSEAAERKAKFKQRSERAAAKRSENARERRSLKVVAGRDLQGDRQADLKGHRNGGDPARGSPPPPTSTKEVEVESPQTPASTTTSSPPTKGSAPTSPRSLPSGPFMPARTNDWDRPAAPGPKSEFLQAWEKAQQGDSSALDELKARRADMPINNTLAAAMPDHDKAPLNEPIEPQHQHQEAPGERPGTDDDINEFLKF